MPARKATPAALITSIAEQLDGRKLPNLKEFEGQEIVVRVEGGRLRWSHRVAPINVEVMCW